MGEPVDDADRLPASFPVPEPVPTPDPTPAPAPVPQDADDDLFDYDDVDEDTGRTHWLGWLVGAAVLVALMLFLASWIGGIDDEPDLGSQPTTETGATPGGEPESPAEPTTTAKRRNVARGATVQVPVTAPPTTDLDGNLVAYAASQMVDMRPTTTWRMPGDGSGAAIRITLRRKATISRVGLINGYAKKVAGVDWYPNNRRILGVTWGFDDGTTVTQTFAERPRMQRMKIQPVTTRTVTITINSVTAPGNGALGRDYTAISEVSLIGTPAG